MTTNVNAPPTNFVLIVPNVAFYLKYVFDFLNEKKYQIHGSFSDQVKVTMIVSFYFNPDDLVLYVHDQIPEAGLRQHGYIRWTVRRKKIPRHYTKRKIKTNSDSITKTPTT